MKVEMLSSIVYTLYDYYILMLNRHTMGHRYLQLGCELPQ